MSKLEEKATRPKRDRRPALGRRPETPHSAAGWRTEPPASEPSASGVSPAATAAAEPDDEPPGTKASSAPQGLRVAPKAERSPELPMANSSMLALAKGKAPAVIKRRTHVAV